MNDNNPDLETPPMTPAEIVAHFVAQHPCGTGAVKTTCPCGTTTTHHCLACGHPVFFTVTSPDNYCPHAHQAAAWLEHHHITAYITTVLRDRPRPTDT